MCADENADFISGLVPFQGEKRLGAAGIMDVLNGLEYPAERSEVVRTAGNSKVEFFAGETVTLGEVIARSDRDHFASVMEIAKEVDQILRKGRREAA
jgi:hypothetical protein